MKILKTRNLQQCKIDLFEVDNNTLKYMIRFIYCLDDGSTREYLYSKSKDYNSINKSFEKITSKKVYQFIKCSVEKITTSHALDFYERNIKKPMHLDIKLTLLKYLHYALDQLYFRNIYIGKELEDYEKHIIPLFDYINKSKYKELLGLSHMKDIFYFYKDIFLKIDIPDNFDFIELIWKEWLKGQKLIQLDPIIYNKNCSFIKNAYIQIYHLEEV